MYFTWVPEGAWCTGSLLHLFFRVICTRCYEMRVFYVGAGRSAVHGVSFACIFTCNLHIYEMHVFCMGPGRSAVHGVSFAYVLRVICACCYEHSSLGDANIAQNWHMCCAER